MVKAFLIVIFSVYKPKFKKFYFFNGENIFLQIKKSDAGDFGDGLHGLGLETVLISRGGEGSERVLLDGVFNCGVGVLPNGVDDFVFLDFEEFS